MKVGLLQEQYRKQTTYIDRKCKCVVMGSSYAFDNVFDGSFFRPFWLSFFDTVLRFVSFCSFIMGAIDIANAYLYNKNDKQGNMFWNMRCLSVVKS